MSSRTRRRPVTAAAVLAAAALALTGCTNGFDAATNVEYIPAEGASLDTENVALRNVVITADPGEPATLSATLIGTGGSADRVLSVEAGDPVVRGAVSGTGTEGGRIAVGANQTVVVGVDGGPQVTFTGGTFTPGRWVPVTFVLESGEATGTAMVRTDVRPATPTASPAAHTEH